MTESKICVELTVRSDYKSQKTGTEYWILQDDFGNEQLVKKAYICDTLMRGDRCLFKVQPGCSDGRGYFILNFLKVVKHIG